MWKHPWLILAAVTCMGCAPSKDAAAPSEEAPSEEAPAAESETTEQTPPPEAEAAGSEAAPEKSESAASKDDKAEGKSGSSKKSCDGLAKDKCKITSGCAWNDLNKGKCVEEGASE